MPIIQGAVCLHCHQKIWTRDGSRVTCRCGELEIRGTGAAVTARGSFVELVPIVVPYRQLELPLA